jgi:thiol-disulfide isomerase/thioredoxin
MFIGVAVVVLIVMQGRRPKAADPHAGQPLPPLNVAGWINVDRPIAAADLQGKVVLIDFWATWCRPCVRGIPELIQLGKRYRDAGVVVVGLTAEDGAAAQQVKNFVATKDGMDWPIGYGAGPTFQMMGIDAIPTYVLYDKSGASVWSGNSLDGIDEALVRALAEK